MPLRLVSRKEWGATPPDWRVPLEETPVPYVVLKYFSQSRTCTGDEQCFRLLKAMQVHQRDELGFADIENNFFVGCDGTVYEGRGWTLESTNYHEWGGRSIDITYIGDYRVNDPPPVMVQAVNDLIEYGIQNNYIRPDYKEDEIRFWDYSMDYGHPSRLMEFDPTKDTEYFVHNRLAPPLVVVVMVLSLYRKSEWGGLPPTSVKPLTVPVPNVVLRYHSKVPQCKEHEECKFYLLSLQKYQIQIMEYPDLEYSFYIAGTGAIFEGRGWTSVPKEDTDLSGRCLDIAYMGDFPNGTDPPDAMIEARNHLIAYGIENDFIKRDYKLVHYRLTPLEELQEQPLNPG